LYVDKKVKALERVGIIFPNVVEFKLKCIENSIDMRILDIYLKSLIGSIENCLYFVETLF